MINELSRIWQPISVKEMLIENFLSLTQVESSSIAQWLLKGLKVREVACGTRHALFCIIDGSLFACGKNNRGQLGTADKADTNIPKIVPNIQNSVTQIASGSFHSICCTGKIKFTHIGLNSYHQ